jgi:hypothetical protein
MTAKATIAGLQDLGFQPGQFNSPTDWDVADTGYLARILNRVSTIVSALVGDATYAGITTGVKFELLAQAEEKLVEAELWKRLEAAERALVGVNGGQQGTETISSRKLQNADEAHDAALDLISRVTGVQYSGGLSVGYVESGLFADTTV